MIKYDEVIHCVKKVTPKFKSL